METVYEDGVMKLLSRESFAGSVATMHRCLRTVVSAGIPLRDAVRMASENSRRGTARKPVCVSGQLRPVSSLK